ncbi:hypothetical protein ACMD2_15746 [Ananas comosus]|uniref:Uncharacterized protein n=1 Tax=Ananas comosus TaxID=4615 RepID=A0A199V4A5_ANACO|nr:hypothetical protein ACMD2_15746 [Ananas comosus]
MDVPRDNYVVDLDEGAPSKWNISFGTSTFADGEDGSEKQRSKNSALHLRQEGAPHELVSNRVYDHSARPTDRADRYTVGCEVFVTNGLPFRLAADPNMSVLLFESSSSDERQGPATEACDPGFVVEEAHVEKPTAESKDPKVKASLARVPMAIELRIEEEPGRACWSRRAARSYKGKRWLKHERQGWHCVQTRSLPVSRLSRRGCGGVPMETPMVYSPAFGKTGTSVVDIDLAEPPAALDTSIAPRALLRSAMRCRSSNLVKFRPASTPSKAEMAGGTSETRRSTRTAGSIFSEGLTAYMLWSELQRLYVLRS